MKKYAILLLAGSIIGFSSCGDDSDSTTQEQIDSAANARAAAIEAELTAKNDSLINAMAMMKADSAARADSLARTTVSSTTTTRTTTTTKTTKPATKPVTKQSDQDRKFQEMGGETGTKENTEISKEKKKEQDDKFKQMGGK